MMTRRLIAACLLMLLAPALPALALTTRECYDCHSEVEEEAFKAWVHGDMECTDCHATLAKAKDDHATPVAGVECADCHDDAVKAMGASAHSPRLAQVPEDLPTCVSCHGKHDILPKSNIDSRVNLLNVPFTCCRCHGSADIRSRHPRLKSDACRDYEEGMHGRVLMVSGVQQSASCLRCHGAHDIRSTSEENSRVSRRNVNRTCGACHMGVLRVFNASVHGRKFLEGDPKAPTCVTCHGSHATERAMGTIFDVRASAICTSCHEEAGRTFGASYHGKVTILGYGKAAQCSDCHGSHSILPASDPASRVNQANLTRTCGVCHPGGDASFVQYMAHLDARDEKKNPMYYYVFLGMVCLVTGTFSFFGLHTVLWFIRAFIDKVKNG